MKKKQIKITCTGTDYKDIDELTAFQGNLKKLSKGNLEKLKKSILKYGFSAPIFIWKSSKKNNIIDGHGRLKALISFKNDGYIIPDIPVDYIEAKTKKEAKEKLLHITSQYGDFDLKGIDEFILDLDMDFDNLRIYDLNTDIIIDNNSNSKSYPELTKVEINKIIEDTISKHNKIYMAFSGGKDSSLALLKIIPILEKMGKNIIAIYVSNGVEFPDILSHVYRFTNDFGIQLQILNSSQTFFDIYNKKWPDVIYRDCIDLLINKPIDKFCNKDREPYLLIRGGMKNQKTTLNTLNKDNQFNGLINTIKSKPFLTILNPIFLIQNSNEEYAKVPLWSGYDKGFCRTACWCCPFQRPKQWDAIKKYYPMLFEELKYWMSRLYLKYHPEKGKGGFIDRMQTYWEKEGITIKMC